MANYLKINGNLLLYNGKLIKVPNLDPSNIKSGVEILGVIGTYSNSIDGVVSNDGELEIYYSDKWSTINVYKDNAYVNVANDTSATVNLGTDLEDWSPTITLNYKSGNITANNLSAENIKSGVSILGVTGTYSGETPQTQEKSVTPTKSIQEVTADTGYYLSKVTVSAIPDNYIIPSGSKTITENGTNIDIRSYSTVSVNVPTSSSSSIEGVDLTDGTLYINSGNYEVMLYSSSVTYVLQDNASVHISAPSRVSLESDTNLTYKSGTVTAINLTADNIKSGVSILGVTGTYNGSGSAINGVIEENGMLVVENSTYYSSYVIRDVDNVANVALVEDSNITLEASDSRNEFTLNYVDGTVVANNLTPENIKSGVSILGVSGTYEGNTPSVSFDSATGTLTITTSGV